MHDAVHAQFVPAFDGNLTEQRIEVRNPANIDEIVGTFPLIGASHVDAAVAAAREAQVAWAALGARARHARLQAGASAMMALPGLDELIARETGKTLEQAKEKWFLKMMLDWYDGLLDEIDEPAFYPDDGRSKSWGHRVPFGVVGAITPYNAPLLLSSLKLAPALMMGNTVVLAVSPTAPLGTLYALRELSAHLPPGVLSVVTGPPQVVAQRLVEHPGVRKVSFTGSIPTARIIGRLAAEQVKSVTLELGGNDPAIVLDDCILDDAFFNKVAIASTYIAGQMCFAIKRLYVPRAKLGEVVDGLIARFDQYVVGDPLNPATTMGPLHTNAQREKLRGMLAEARTTGASIRECGKLEADPDRGWFVRPAVVWNVRHDTRLVQDEQFGPALPVIPYDSVDAAVQMANDTEFGLASSVWSEDERRARELALRIEAGASWINNHGLLAYDFRPGVEGMKQSANGGAEDGRAGLHTYSQSHSVVVPRR